LCCGGGLLGKTCDGHAGRQEKPGCNPVLHQEMLLKRAFEKRVKLAGPGLKQGIYKAIFT
jgi:hypothetical protein